jgi:hypothetical protein
MSRILLLFPRKADEVQDFVGPSSAKHRMEHPETFKLARLPHAEQATAISKVLDPPTSHQHAVMNVLL